MTALKGRRILVVDDEFLVASLAEDFLSELGASVVGPAAGIAAAVKLIETVAIDAAMLDVNLNGERSDEVAAALRAKGIPFVLVTGYGASKHSAPFGAPVLGKPFSIEDVAAVLDAIL